MRFTKLKLNGFKSFVDPTDLVIHDGLTGVVGPNGCGKSNLLEALRWVMGENRPTAMRGGGMEDVIFAGTSTRGARHFAEVALQIDNHDRLAPSGFNDADMVEITRRITRDAGSTYKANSKEVRARDVQMLFADASTGSHSPALVRQGQISELINAKPKARRRILEEAAGISGLYARRHEAELKLSGADQNLARVDDVLKGLSQQVALLTRQATQAARYREIGEALRRAEGQLLYRRWREAEAARIAAEEELALQIAAAAQADHAIRTAQAGRETHEAALPALREEDAIASAVLQRLELQRDALTEQETRAATLIEALRSRLSQLDHDIAREGALNLDADETIARLTEELETLQSAQDGHGAALEEAAELAREASSLLSEREDLLSQSTEDSARLAAKHQSAHRLVSDTRAQVERAETEAQRARDAVQSAQAALVAATEAFEAAAESQDEAAALTEACEEALEACETGRAEAQARESEARALRGEAEAEARSLRAEVQALTRLVEREAQAANHVIDRVSVSAGYELALGAALADDLRMPEIGGDIRSGWAALPEYDQTLPLPPEAAALAQFVEAPAALARRLAQIGLVPRDQGADLQARLKPGQRLVSPEGDLWRWDGFCAMAEDAPSAAAARLVQKNRLIALNADLAELSARAAAAATAHAICQDALAQKVRDEQLARDARRAADLRLSEANRTTNRTEAERAIASGKLESARLAVGRFGDEATQSRIRLRDAEAQAQDLPPLETAKTRVETARMAVEAARLTMLTRRSLHDELRREGEARAKRRIEAVRELSTWRQRLDTAQKRNQELAARRIETEAELEDASALPEELAASREEISDAITQAEGRRQRAGTALAAAEAALRDAQIAEREAERLNTQSRELRARGEARTEAARATVTTACERITEELQTTPEALAEQLGHSAENLPSAADLDAEVERLKRQREALGAVNLRAEEDMKAIAAEHLTLAQEKADLEQAIKKLRAGIASLNKEGRERLLAAFDQVNANFRTLFTHLFGGGEARLVLVESEDPLDAGLEIMCQPPGKKLSTLSLLSGGEQTLTALSLIFAVFLANPAPICVLDEVDAPLDDANVTRFCDLLDEMTRRTDTRFLIITHHAVTMSRMDRLFGVTMQEQGVSQLVSVDLKKAEALVA